MAMSVNVKTAGVFHLLEIGLTALESAGFFLSVNAGRGRQPEQCDYQKWRE
jgi:hypothetical protein